MKILLVEENLISSEIVPVALESEGLKVSEGADRAAGLKAAMEEHPDLIL